MYKRVAVFLVFFMPSITMGNTVLSISGVSSDTIVVEKEPVNIKFHINQPASVVMKIYDSIDRLVSKIQSPGLWEKGDHTLFWNAKDGDGNTVDPGEYHYVLEAKTDSGDKTIYDLTDKTGGESIVVENIKYNPETETISYYVPKPARIYLRAGLKDAFVIRTIVNNAIRMAGYYEQAWNGMDADKVISIKQHPKLQFYGEGYQLSRNSLIVKGLELENKPVFKQSVSFDEIRQSNKKSKGLNRHAYHKVDQCRDIKIYLDILGQDKVDKNTPVVEDEVKLQVRVDEKDLFMIEAERSEIVFFLGNELIYENEVSYYPYNWTWKPKKLPSGEYTLTAFVVGFHEHFGVTAVRVKVP